MISELLAHNVEWSTNKRKEDPDYFKRLSGIQRPQYLWIGCSDSRVPANVITGLEPGEVFVHRNVANLVHPNDLNLLSVVEFAVNALDVTDIIVCGHYGCGGVRAAVDGEWHGIVDHWLQPIRDVYDYQTTELTSIQGEEPMLDRLCELSIAAQVEKLSRTPIIQSAWQRGKELHIHGWVYGLRDGLIRDLNCGCSSRHGANSADPPR